MCENNDHYRTGLWSDRVDQQMQVLNVLTYTRVWSVNCSVWNPQIIEYALTDNCDEGMNNTSS